MTLLEGLLFLLAGITGFGLGWVLFSKRLAKAQETAIRLKAEKDSAERRLQEQPQQVKLMASAMFEELSGKFSAQSEEKIGHLLNPMRERLIEFQKLVGDSFTAQRTEQNSLKSEIGKIIMQADSLAKALRGDVKAQGNWGEVMLEKILEESGLRKGEDYILQGTDMGLVAADGSRQQPDVIVKLPDHKHIIIDSKVSLLDYERFCAAGDEKSRAMHLDNFLRSLQAHIVGLSGKNYQHNEKLNTPDYVLMFMPIEGAYSLALQRDPQLHAYAWSRKIVLVCPSFLLATLRTVSSLWSIERQNKHAQQIALEAAKMYDKFVDFISDMEGVGGRLGQLQASYDNAFNKLSKGRGNLIGRAEKLRELGAKSTKSLPKHLTGGEENEALEMPALELAAADA